MSISADNLKRVENLIKNYKYNCEKLNCRKIDLEYFIEYEPKKTELIEKIKNDLSLLTKENRNIKRCLGHLTENEYKFISEIYYNFKEYQDIIPLMRSIFNTRANDKTIREYCTGYKKQILTKLLESNILEEQKNELWQN